MQQARTARIWVRLILPAVLRRTWHAGRRLRHCKLEGSVEECGVQGFAEWEVCGFHGVYSIADLSGSGDNVRDVDDQQTGNNADGQH